MDPGALNFAWSCRILAILGEWGVTEVGVSPGSRSGPLVLAAAQIGARPPRIHLDERSAGFFALGYGRARAHPAAIITTSGTAVANLLPAVVEADLSDIPLVLLTADRPLRLRGADANQTIEQPGIFGKRVRFEADLPTPSPALLAAEGADSPFAAVRRALTAALGPPAGPVHLNVPFEKPLEPASPDDLLRIAGTIPQPEWGRVHALGADLRESRSGRGDLRRAAAGSPAKGEESKLAAQLARAERPLLVAGPASRPERDGLAAVRFAAAHSLPLLADPLSGARFATEIDPGAPVLGGYDHFLRIGAVARRCSPDLVIRIGRTPTSATLEAALAGWRESVQVVIDDGSRPKDHQRLAHLYLKAPAADLLDSLARTVPHPPPPARLPWLHRWRDLEAATWEAIDPATLSPGHEGAYAAALLAALPPGSALFASSSMPVRDLDGYGRPAPAGVTIFANRGASGIDGVVSSALGCAAGRGGPVAVLIGDIALIHDMNGLLAARDPALNVVFVVIDNDGGGIFHMLPIRKFEPVFTPCFATPHGLDFSHLARLHGLPLHHAATPRALAEAVAAALSRPGTEIVRAGTNREENRRLHEETRSRVMRRIQSRFTPSEAPS